ncbi:unnamed protein product [Penicillium salamii]|uniref:Allergen Asp f 4 n=1 Tax=Penicillium salamii TaxID=1612424 RepID=A0A9W4INR8_9EURO|nr:unnamed protein product [Penicillium salamii]CAG8389209.1 unnamed protein product [Penicillium salamii]CAG8392416.1 unnamed protein product [Penicillium salamii]CAG8409137.1 unnamed protein product [Penicillium salamii]
MRWISISLLAAGLITDVFASVHHYHAHRHRHHLMHHGPKLDSRDLAQDNVQNIPEDVVVSTTLTTTTTIYGKCAPTSTVSTTLETINAKPEPTQKFNPEHEYPQPLWNPFGSNTEPTSIKPHLPEPEPTSTTFITKTIHKTATDTVVVTVYPEDRPTALPNPPPRPPTDKISLADTLPQDSSEEKVAGKEPPKPAPPKPAPQNNSPVNAVLDLPGQVLPDIPVVNQLIPGQKPKPHPPSPVDWTATPPKGDFSLKGFGGRTPGKGNEIHYHGNTGKPWGSNIIMIDNFEAHRFKYVVKFSGSNDKPWTVVVWNKIGPDGKLDGWYGHSAVTFTLPPGETRYVAFDEDSEGAWGAAPGDHLPKDKYGGYSSTWGEFSFGDGENNGWSGWDVSAIQAQIAKQHVQGMSICQADGKGCSVITPGAKRVVDAYTEAEKHKDGIGGAASPGPVRLDVVLDYRG